MYKINQEIELKQVENKTCFIILYSLQWKFKTQTNDDLLYQAHDTTVQYTPYSGKWLITELAKMLSDICVGSHGIKWVAILVQRVAIFPTSWPK